MKIYNENTEFTFGKYEGKSLQEVSQIDTSYIDWCLCNLDHFCLEDEVFEHLKNVISAEGITQQTEKWSNYLDEDDDNYRNHDYDRDTFNALTDGQYGDYDDFDGDFDSLMDGMGY